MRDFVRINRLTEDNFTEIIELSGGFRFSKNDSKEKHPNADYVIDNAIVELKLIEEEGFDKKTRQQKLAELFVKYDKSPVVVVDPSILSNQDQRTYFNILEGPIKTHVKTASRQLKATKLKLGDGYKKILLIVNNGYSAMTAEEFKRVVDKCVKNDAKSIDYVISCGIYYYSDGFDSYVIAPFELEKIHSLSESYEFEAIQKSWSGFLNRHMTEFLIEPEREENARLPVLDLEFEVGDVTFIKPTPPFGKKSEYWVAGRPRINSSGIEKCPLVGMTFPKLSRKSWELIKGVIEDSWKLQDSYEAWVKFALNEEDEYKNDLQPFVPVTINFDDLSEHVESGRISRFIDLCNYSNDVFSDLLRELIFSSRDFDDTSIELNKYILLVNREIGRDKKNDLCSIYIVRGINDPEVIETFIENIQMLFEHGLSLASAYALKTGIDVVLHRKDKQYAWT